jgi:hypothetical protein
MAVWAQVVARKTDMRHVILALGLAAGAARADLPPLKTAETPDVTISIWTYLSLEDEEVALLNTFLGQPSLLQGWLPLTGYGALAIAPDEGLWRQGARVPSAVAVGGMTSYEAASVAALAGCNALRQTAQPCLVVLQVAQN